MATIGEIKSKIDLLDASKFQELCDTIIKMYYKGTIISYGINNSGRTIKGTPDSFVLLPNSTLFVECTIQKDNLCGKLASDIKKCLNNKVETLKSIILCFTGRLSVIDCDKLTKLTLEGINIEFMGIDEIANRIYFNYPFLAKDYLNLSMDTGQIISVDSFLTIVDVHSFSAPLNVNFLFREKDIENINEKLLTNDIIMLYGLPGCGKTRLGLKILQNETKRICYVIKNKNIPIFEDLNRFFQKGKKYLVMIDDANQLSQFGNVVDFIIKNFNSGDFKIIITVRDYAKKSIKLQLESLPYRDLKIDTFTSDEIKSMLKTNLKILNDAYLDQIAIVSKGNARIAYMIGLAAVKNNILAEIHNNEEVLGIFYKQIIERISGNSNYLLSLGIMSFFNKLNLNDTELFDKISVLTGLDTTAFLESITFLHNNELLNIINEKIIMIADETLSNYIFYYVFIDKKIINIVDLIKSFYISHIKTVISAINSSLSIFHNKSLNIFQEATTSIFKELMTISKEVALDFSLHFSPLFELEAIQFLQDYINKMPFKQMLEPYNINVDILKINISIKLLQTMRLLSHGQCYLEVFELFIEILQKDEININEVFATVLESYKMNQEDLRNLGNRQMNIMNFISSNIEKPYVKEILYTLALNYVSLDFDESSYTGNKSINYCHVKYNDECYNCDFRKLLWNLIKKYCDSDMKNRILLHFLTTSGIYDVSQNIVKSEISFLVDLFLEIVSYNPIIAIKIEDLIRHCSINFEAIDNIMCNKNIIIYKLIMKKNFKRSSDRKDYDEKNMKLLIEFAHTLSEENMNCLLEFIDFYFKESDKNNYVIDDSLRIILINLTNEKFLLLLNYLFDSGYPILFYPNQIVEKILSSGIDFISYISKKNMFPYRDNWKLYYFENIDIQLINNKLISEFTEFLIKYEVNGTHRDLRVEQLLKYKEINNEFPERFVEITLAKSDNTFLSFTSLLFNEHIFPPKDLLIFLNNRLDLMIKVYFKLMRLKNDPDYNKEYIMFICSIDKNAISKYVDAFLSIEDHRIYYDRDALSFIWRLDSSDEIANEVLCKIVSEKNKNPFKYYINNPIKLLESESDNTKYYNFLKKRIVISKDSTEISLLSDAVIGTIIEKELFKVFIVNESDFSLFENYSLLPSSYSWSGSAIPHINQQILFLNEILSLVPRKVNYTKHRIRIEEMIKGKELEIKYQEEREIFDDF